MILRHRLIGRKGGDDAAQAASDLVAALPASATEMGGDEVASGGLASAAADSSDGCGGLVGDADDVRMGAPEEGAYGAAEPGDAASDEATPLFWTDLHTAINRQDWDSVLRVFAIAHHTVVSSVFCGWRRG